MTRYRNLTPRQKLAIWWWGLEEKERAAIRRQFKEKLETDPVFSMQVRRLLQEERAREREHA